MSDMFSAEQFLDMQVDGAMDTKVVPVPVGEFLGICTEVKARTWASKKDPSKSGVTLDLTWEIEDQNVKAMLGREKVTVRQGIMLDLTESGGLDIGKGKNVGLGRVREAVGLNSPGQPFSATMIVGRPAKLKVTHRVDGETIYAEVSGVTRAQ